MALDPTREPFIPLRKAELVELLCAEAGLAAEERTAFQYFCRLLEATFHYEFNRHLQELKAAYAPFDPDTDMQALFKLGFEEKQKRLNDLFSDFGWLLDRANFRHLNRQDIEPALHGGSDWGVHLDTDFGVFDRLAMFARGDIRKTVSRRRWQNFYRLEKIDQEVYQRFVLILKLKPHRRLGRDVDTTSVYLKIFKDIPKLDIKMLLPGSRVRLTFFDQGKIGLPLLSGIGMALWKIAAEIVKAGFQIADDLFGYASNPTLAFWGLTSGVFGYGYKSYYGYQQTKQRYHHDLTQSLYYQNLDSNSGVLFRLLDEAEEQEFREAVLAFFFLWRRAGPKGWTVDELDGQVEYYLEQNAKVKIDFEIRDALKKLQRFRLLETEGDRYRIPSLQVAIERLDAAWDSYFQ